MTTIKLATGRHWRGSLALLQMATEDLLTYHMVRISERFDQNGCLRSIGIPTLDQVGACGEFQQVSTSYINKTIL